MCKYGMNEILIRYYQCPLLGQNLLLFNKSVSNINKQYIVHQLNEKILIHFFVSIQSEKYHIRNTSSVRSYVSFHALYTGKKETTGQRKSFMKRRKKKSWVRRRAL